MTPNAFLRSFARAFCPARTLGDIRQFDKSSELLSQIPGSTWATSPENSPGLFLGCQRSNRGRASTRQTIFWCPNGWPDDGPVTTWLGLASSHLGDRLFRDPAIADALRTCLSTIRPAETLVTVQGCTLDLPICRGAKLFHQHLLRFRPLPRNVTPSWIKQTLDRKTSFQTDVFYDAHSIGADDLMFSICDQIRLFRVRPKGKIWSLLKEMSDDKDNPQPDGRDATWAPAMFHLVHPASCESEQNKTPAGKSSAQHMVLEQLRKWGSVDWCLLPKDQIGQSGENVASAWYTNESPNDRCRLPDSAGILGIDDWVEDQDLFLNHWTRFDRSPWPDQPGLTQFDSLFFQQDMGRSPLDTLCRILAGRKLLGSGRLIKGGKRMVSFTEVPLSEFRKRRIFRPQLSRWDFELYGISVRKSVLDGLGVRPVEYQLNRIEKTPSDKRTCDTAYHQTVTKTDWSQEREWRVEGDIDLRGFGADDAAVFVPDWESAEKVQPFSIWPVVVLQSTTVAATES